MKYQIQIKEKTYDFEVENHQPNLEIFYQNKLVDFDFQHLDGNLYSLILEGRQHLVWLEPKDNGDYRIILNQETTKVVVEDDRQRLRKAFRATKKTTLGITQIRAPMPGLVSQVDVEPNQKIGAGEGLLIIEAMKMENEIKSPVDGKISQLKVKQGDAIEKDTLLMEIVDFVD